MKQLTESTNSKSLSINSSSDKFILRCGYQEMELNEAEYALVDRLLQGIMNGAVHPNSFYRCKRTGETINLTHFAYLIRKKESKILGEDIAL